MATALKIIATVIIGCAIAITAWQYAKPEDPPLDVVDSVDLDRYLGKWYEIARFEHRFQEGCVNSTATYSMRDDGDIRVENACEVIGEEGGRSATGRAWIVDDTTNAKLRVQFAFTDFKIPLVSGRYWIIALADDYSHVMVGEPGRDYLWILAREPEISNQITQELLERARTVGFDTDRLIFNADLLER